MPVNLSYNLQFDKLCEKLNLGQLAETPESVSGGYIHRMFSLKTTKGRFAVKALNPNVMLRPKAFKNITDGESAAKILSGNVRESIRVSSAKTFNESGTLIQELDGQFYLIYDWIDGISIKGNQITSEHCRKIAQSLATIHSTDFSSISFIDEYSFYEPYIDWQFYLEKGISQNSEWTDLLSENIDKLNQYYAMSVEAGAILSSDTVIGHGDLDPKNVMWVNDTPIIIDWEAAGIINPFHDLIETAMYWAKNEDDTVDKNKFITFIDEYKKGAHIVCDVWKPALNIGFSGKMGWLEYSLKRSLGLESSDEDERKMGTSHVFNTINEILQYAETIVIMEKWLEEIR